MTTPINDVDTLVSELVENCRSAGLNAEVVAPTRVRVSSPGADRRLEEIIRCMPDGEERLTWWWSWNEPICPATQIADAVRRIAYVVSPSIVDGR
jgi:hypothetical protein